MFRALCPLVSSPIPTAGAPGADLLPAPPGLREQGLCRGPESAGSPRCHLQGPGKAPGKTGAGSGAAGHGVQV